MTTCECRCHHYGAGTHVTCDVDTGSSGTSSVKSCSPCDGVRARAGDAEQAPCVYPRCDDGTDDHEPNLTKHVICGPCRKRYGKLLGWLVEDYVTIKSAMQPPASRGNDESKHMSPKSKSFGHPAQWASDAARQIAATLNEIEDELRDLVGDEPAAHPLVTEVHLVIRGRDYLRAHFDLLCRYQHAQHWAAYLVDLHGKMRSSLGQTRFTEKLPTPCPSCDVAALVRSVGQIDCGNCGRTIEERQYPFLTRMVLDDLISDYDRRAREAELLATYGPCEHCGGPRNMVLDDTQTINLACEKCGRPAGLIAESV